MFFPSMFDNILEKETFSLRKKRLLAVCDMLLVDDDEKEQAGKELFDIELQILKIRSPKNFMGVESYEIKFEKNYQSVVCNLSSHTNKEVGKMKVIEVYTLMEMLKQKEQQNGKR